MALHLTRIIRDEERRSYTDQRRQVRYIVAEYRGTDGEEYRKSFEGTRGQALNVPSVGTHAELNALKIQW